MIRLNYKKHLSYSVFVAILAIVLMAMPDQTVESQTVADRMRSPFKFDRFQPPVNDVAHRITAPAAAGALIEKSTIDFSSSERANAAAIQTDGKIVAVGSTIVEGSTPGFSYDFAVSRYNADGSLDTSFDADGKVSTSFSSEYANHESAYAVAIQPDVKIIAAGSCGGSFSGQTCLARYNTDGSLDTSFGSGGKVVTAGYSSVSELVVQTDNKIIVATPGFSVLRYNTNGTLDATFGTGGAVTTLFDFGYPTASSVALQADGKIVAAGYSGYCDKENCYYDFVLARYNTDGSLDTSFEGDGKVTTPFDGQSAGANGVVVQPDGKIVAAGWGYDTGLYFAAARYSADGTLDASFDGDGKVVHAFPLAISSVALQSDGKIVASGTVNENFSLLRLNTDGSLDSSFDGDGTLINDFGDREFGGHGAIQADGRIVTAGTSGHWGNGFDAFDFALARYNTDGSLDTAFDADGRVTTTFLQIPSVITAIDDWGSAVGYCISVGNDDFFTAGTNGIHRRIFAIGNSDDRAYAAAKRGPSTDLYTVGYSDNGSNTDFAVLKNQGNPGFGLNGRVTTDFGGNNDEARAVVVQPNNNVVVAGQTTIGSDNALALARYTANGQLDTSFGSDGKVVIPALQNARAMALQPDGKFVVGGVVGSSFAIARLNSNGSLDTTFDADGIAVAGFGFGAAITSVALLPYGKIVAAGYMYDPSEGYSIALARFNADGALDASFGPGGKVLTSIPNEDLIAHAVRVQRNGKIVAAGRHTTTQNNVNFAVVRYNVDGSLDTTFDTDGIQTTDFFGSVDTANALAIENDGTIVAGGSAWKDGKTDFATARYVGDAVPGEAKFDFDGDGLSDVSTFRPSNGSWYVERSTLGFLGQQFGVSEDKLAPADYDGDGKTDIAVFRDGTWYIQSSTFVLPENPVYFGLPGDILVPADYSGDGRAELTIYRDGYWWSLRFRSEEASVVQFGLPNDKPVPADYDGDGRVDQAVYRNGIWHLNRSYGGYTAVQFGLAADRPVAADYDGDGKADLAVYRDGTWYILQSTDGFAAFQFGLSTDIPVPADYDGDGKTDIAVYRDGTWYLQQSSGGFVAQQFGLQNDKPIPSAYLGN